MVRIKKRSAPIVEENEAEALALLLARCIRRLGPLHDPGPEVIHRLSPLARAEIERHMEEAAPQVDLTLAAHCPECGREFAVPFDLQGFFLGRVSKRVVSFSIVRCITSPITTIGVNKKSWRCLGKSGGNISPSSRKSCGE